MGLALVRRSAYRNQVSARQSYAMRRSLPRRLRSSHCLESNARLILLLHRLRLIPRDAPLVAIREIRHMSGDGREISDLNRRIRLLARTNAVDPVLHVVLIGSLAGKRGSVFTVYSF